jgi:uncharacterized iron-regulated membrane protein
MIFGRFIKQPQKVWTRRALFQVHLWTGIGLGLYMLMISVSGSAIVFRREITRLSWTAPTVRVTGAMMSAEQLTAAAKKAYPRFEGFSVTFDKNPTRAAVVKMARGQRTRERAFDPPLLSWTVRLHDDLLADRTGRFINMFGAVALLLLCFTGAVIWWPGIARWWRALFVWRGVGWKRVNFDLHSALGFWLFLFVLMWGISGIYLSYAEPFTWLVDKLQPPNLDTLELRSGDKFLEWLARVHFGRAYGTTVKWLYVVLGFVPAVLFVTGGIMWWNRVLVPVFRKNAREAERLQPAVSTMPSQDVGLEPDASLEA